MLKKGTGLVICLLLAAALTASVASAAQPTAEKSFVVETSIFTKWLTDTNRQQPGEGFQGNVNGTGTELELNIRGYVSKYVEAFARVQSRLGGVWSDYWNNKDLDDADYMKFRGAFVKLKSLPLPTRPTFTVGSSDVDMFSPFTLGRIRYTERDNLKGIFVRGDLGGGIYNFTRISLPKLWGGPGWSTGSFTTKDYAWGLGYDRYVMSGKLRIETNLGYVQDKEVDTDADGNQVVDDGIIQLTDRFANLSSSLELTLDVSDSSYLNTFFGYSDLRNRSGVAGDYSPILHKDANDFFVIGRWESYDLGGSGLNLKAEIFHFGEDWSSILAARRESDVLLTEGFTHEIGFSNDSQMSNPSGDSHQVATLNADNDFVDWDESIAETVIGWQGVTIAPELERGLLKLRAEVTYLDYATNKQNRDMTKYPTFEWAGGGSIGVVDTTGTMRGVRDIYNRNQDRNSMIVSAGGQYRFSVFQYGEVGAKVKYVKDTDDVDTSISSDDYTGDLLDVSARLGFQFNSELFAGIGLQTNRYQEENALYRRDWAPSDRSALIAEKLDTTRDKVFGQLSYNFGRAAFNYRIEYINTDRDITAGGLSSTSTVKGEIRSKATLSVGF
ncbi:MAG: hypothetical protein HYV63_34265 [Candidatus Schekmanbacteria bacterium]|nr:hypothetical protein [Candidatus Schekmanbacteria bacterium]